VIALSRPFSLPYHPARAYLLQKGLYLLLAFDVWLTMLPHGARYGMGGFNASHFGFLDVLFDALGLLPSAAFYVGLLLLTGGLSLMHVLTGGARFLRAAVFALYTTSWLVSLFDSYQHHYLLSWLLLWTVFMPDVEVDAACKRDVAPAYGWGLPMTALTCGIVYAFTAISKSEADWRAGHVLVRLSKSAPPGSSAPGVLDPLRDLLMSWFAIPEYVAWAWIAQSVILLQIVAAVGYFAASGRDGAKSRLRTWACALSLPAVLSFHAFAELGGMFDIGWFSYYMLWIGLVLLTPAAWVAELARVITWPVRRFAARFDAVSEPRPAGALLQLTAAAGSCAVLGASLDLPGAGSAGWLLALLILGWGALQVRAAFLGSAQRLAIAGMLTSLACFIAFQQSDARYDYYRWAGGELRSLGALPEALAMYKKADHYAGPGRSRQKQIAELEQMIRATARDSD